MQPEIPLHDIKGLVEIPDNSLYFFIATILISITLIVIAIIFILRFFKRDKAIKLQKVYLETLSQLELTNSKQAAYELTHYGNLLEKNEEQNQRYETLIKALETYKYQKEVPPFNERDTQAIHHFLEVINAR